MEKTIRFYKNKITAYTAIREALKKKIYGLGTARLFLFVGALVTVWLCRNAGSIALMGIVTAFALPFIILMVLHTRLFAKKAYAEAMILLNTNELMVLNYDFSAFDGAPEQIDSQHPFSLDLDLFGNHSLFQCLNRTVTWMGKACLVDWFTRPLDDKQAILDRQQATQELADKIRFRQHFYVTGASKKYSDKDMQLLNALAERKPLFARSILWKIGVWAIPLLWLIVSAGCIGGIFPLGVLGILFAFSFLIANVQGPNIHKLYNSVNTIEKVLLIYSQLLEQIEKEPFHSEFLKSNKKLLDIEGKQASQIIRQLSGIIGALDQRYSLAGIVLNLLYLRDMRHAMQLEGWIDMYAKNFDVWFKSLAQIDAMCSLGGFAFNHPDYTYPEIANTYFEMNGMALGHPLLHRDQCVRNDLQITKNPYFLVITGANMAGKSTYLRTVGVNFFLACMGLPVCAKSLTVYPAHLITSLRTADSLTANESYFFAELKRLKMIIDRLNAGEKLFIVLDEILKGTNSKDKQKGSLALVKQLISKQTCGIIATHDLLLGSLEQEFPDEIKNYRFEADITNDKLTFTYLLREGVAQNMNASFLMKKMGITL